MDYKRMPIEIESPEQMGYENVRYNLTESSVSDAVFSETNFNSGKLRLAYGDHRGKRELRELLAAGLSNVSPEDILITAGAASALFIVATSLLEKGDHMIVLHPNYSSNIETPRAIGCSIDFVNLTFENDFQVDPAVIQKLLRPETKLISLTSPHNPTGTVIPAATIIKIAEMAKAKGCFVLLDETYRELSSTQIAVQGAELHENVISVSSVSKAYGLPGLRIGWLICRNKELGTKFLAAKEQIFLCNSILDEEVAFHYLQQKESVLMPVHAHVATNKRILTDWLSGEKRLEVILPAGGVVCFPRVKEATDGDMARFYSILNSKYETFVGPGHWFEMPPQYMRIGFGWPDKTELKQGLKNISSALSEL